MQASAVPVTRASSASAMGGGEIAAANRQQDGGIAQLHPCGRGCDPGMQCGQCRVGVAACFLRRGQPLAIVGICRVARYRLAEAGDGVRRTRSSSISTPSIAFAAGSSAVENHCFRRIRGRAFLVIHLHADIGPALAQSGVLRRLRNGLIQFYQGNVESAFMHCQPGGEFRKPRRRRSKAAHGRQQGPGGAETACIDQ